MAFSNKTYKRLQIGLAALLAVTSSLTLQAQDIEQISLAKHKACKNPSPDNLFIEWRAGATNLDLNAEATMTIYNKDTKHPFVGGEVVDGVFKPCWQLYFNQPYTTATGETRAVVEASDITLNYFVLTPTESFGSIPPGGSITLNMVSGFQNATVFGLIKISKNGSALGMHISYNDPDFANFVPIKTIVDINDPAVMSRLPLALSFFGIADVVPPDTPNTRFPRGVPDLDISLQSSIIPNPTYLATQPGSFNVNTIRSVKAQNGLSFEKDYLKDLLGSLESYSGQDNHVYLKIADGIIPNLPATVNGLNAPESYMLTVTQDRIEIAGADPAGVFYGIQTLRQLIFQAELSGTNSIPAMVISDAPRFPVRGNLLDVARHFIPKHQLYKYIDLLSMFKINRFHWHATDNEGWRLEIPGIPELTKYSAKRSYNPSERFTLSPAFGSTTQLRSTDYILGKPKNVVAANFGVVPTWQGFEDALNNFIGVGTGFYSTGDIEDILRYAYDRHIDVQIEVDMPAHARAAIMAMEYRYRKYADSNPKKANEYRLINPLDPSESALSTVDPCLSSTFNFLNKVVKEIKKRYDKAGVPFKYFHLGGDEVPGIDQNTTWPLCQNGLTSAEKLEQFLVQYNTIVNSYGAGTQAWSDSTEFELTSPAKPLKAAGLVTQVWNNVVAPPPQGQAYEFANDGFPVILSHATNLYLDAMQSKNPDEIGLDVYGFSDTKMVYSYVPENYIISYITTNLFGDPNNILGPLIGQEINPVVLSTTQTQLLPSSLPNIQGIESTLFGEFRKTYPSTEYLGYPRIIAAAERAWNQNPPVSGFIDVSQPAPALLANILGLRLQIDAAWQVFANALGKYALPMLDYYPKLRPSSHNTCPVNYKIQPPGAVINAGILYMNIEWPGLTFQYSLDQGYTWINWTQPVAVPGPVLVRSITRNGDPSWIEPVLPQ